MQMDYHVWDTMLEHYQTHAKADQHHVKLNDFFRLYGMICFTSLLIRQLYHFFATDFDSGLLQLVGNDIVNTLFKYCVSYRHLIFISKTFELLMKSSAKSDSLFMNIQCAIVCSLEKLNFKI